VHALIEQLAEVEADFQLEDLLYLIKKLMRNTRNLNFTLDQLKNLIDFVMTAEPLMKITVPQAIFYLDALERQGVFRLLNTGIDVIGRIGSRYSADELQQMADGLVRLVAILQKLTAPAALDLLDRAAGLPERMNLEEAAPAGAKTLLGVMGDPDFRQGMGVLLELTRGLAHLKA
jgi:uncharacterized protein YjgD (DUF1641 family)